MKVADYLLKRLAEEGIDTAFTVYGAAIGEIIDAFTRQNKIKYVCPMHEQAAGFMAEGYAKTRGIPGLALSTSGPGALNLITPIANCFYDSVPCIFITGQVNSRFMRPNDSIRQLGFQETPIVDIVRPITKLAIGLTKRMLENRGIEEMIESLIESACEGRPGPVLLDIPIDIQKIEISLRGYNKDRFMGFAGLGRVLKEEKVKEQINQFIEDLEKAKRPALLIGGGVKDKELFRELAEKLAIPCFATWNALDVVTSDLCYYGGRIGTYGGAGRNFGIQNCDLLLALGCRFSGRITGGMPETFARGAKKYVVDLDPELLRPENQQVKADVNIFCDSAVFMRALLEQATQSKKLSDWTKQCIRWRLEYDPVKYEHESGEFHHYGFMRKLSHFSPANAIIVSDTGGNVIMMAHCFETKAGQTVFTSNGNTPMGFAMCGAIGAWFADPTRPVICIIGDGGMNMNIQELQTIINYGVNLKIFIINNHIYGNTKSYQKINYEGRCLTCGPDGYNPPNFIAIAKAYGIESFSLDSWEHFNRIVGIALQSNKACIVDVIHHEHCTYEPRISSFNVGIEDMYPYLPREEFRENMMIEPLSDWENNI